MSKKDPGIGDGTINNTTIYKDCLENNTFLILGEKVELPFDPAFIELKPGKTFFRLENLIGNGADPVFLDLPINGQQLVFAKADIFGPDFRIEEAKQASSQKTKSNLIDPFLGLFRKKEMVPPQKFKLYLLDNGVKKHEIFIKDIIAPSDDEIWEKIGGEQLPDWSAPMDEAQKKKSLEEIAYLLYRFFGYPPVNSALESWLDRQVKQGRF